MSPRFASEASHAAELTLARLRRMPLPRPREDGDKSDRGTVLIAAGSREMPGAAILSATAALRAGAGTLQVATARSIAPFVASELPEARVFGLPETRAGALATTAGPILIVRAQKADALLLGPGFLDERATFGLLSRILHRLAAGAIVLDAAALTAFASDPDGLRRARAPLVLTPHAGEMATLVGKGKAAVQRHPERFARDAVRRFRACVVLKGAETIIVGPDGEAYRSRVGNVGLATSGSGDSLSGLIAGLLARGASPIRAASWAVHLHGLAGDALARRQGPIGYLARELLSEIPRLMR